MQHDDKLQRLIDVLQSDIARMLDSQAARVAGFQDVDFDPLHGVITYVQDDQRLWTAQVEAIGTYSADVSMFRWAWSAYERPPGRSRMNVVYSEGQRLGIPSLTTGQIPTYGEEQAIQLANAAAAIARASGVYRTREPQRLTFFALFEMPAAAGDRLAHSPLPPSVRGGSRFPPAMTPPPPPVQRRTGESVYPAPMPLPAGQIPKPARTPIMSMLPPPPGADMEIPVSRDRWFEPAAEPAQASQAPPRPIREPGRDLVMPIANLVLTAVVAAIPQGFQQALLVVDVTVTDTRARFSAVIVALDQAGELMAIATPQSVMDAIGGLIVEDVKSGNGRWKRLLVKLSQREHRVTMQVSISG